MAIPAKRLNLPWLFDLERIHTMKSNRRAVPPFRDPL
jgi:hypothetical protein